MKDISELGIKVASITFDGYIANIAMCQLLNADIKNKNGDYIIYFDNPFDQNRVYIIFDPSHMIKLVRNTLASRSCLLNGSNEEIKWSNFVDLVNYSRDHRQFGLSHKMNKRHLLWADRKMHVRTAVETLSLSTANSLEFLMKKGVEQFSNAQPNIEFIKIFNSLWDIMNTQSIDNESKHIFKSAINRSNCNEIFKFLVDSKKYILSLKVQNVKTKKWVRIINTKISTGFVVNIMSFTAMYRELVEEHHWLTCLATYRFSQDHLELHFGKIRTLNGHNDNPNAQQFSSAYRKLLYEADLVTSESSNVTARSASNILTVSSSSHQAKKDIENDLLQVEREISFIDPEPELQIEQMMIFENLNDYACDSGIAYIANELEMRLKRCGQIYCQLCLVVLNENEKKATQYV